MDAIFTPPVQLHKAVLVGRLLFVLGAIVNDVEYVDRFLSADEARVLGIHKKIRRLPLSVREALEPEITRSQVEAKITDLEGRIGGRRAPSAADYAKVAGLETYYLTDYSFSSEAAHNVAKDLERHIELDSEGGIDGLRWGPEDVPVSELFVHAVDYALMACFAVERLFGVGPGAELEHLRARVNTLIESEVAG